MRYDCRCNEAKALECIDNFFMVYRIGGSALGVVHQTAPCAIDEAKRLANVILQSAGAFSCIFLLGNWLSHATTKC